MATQSTALAGQEQRVQVQGAGAPLWQGPLCQAISSHPVSILRPLAFFVSWSGVLTLAYTGFPPALTALKRDINSSVSSLKPENPGSMWPKTSLGCLKDDQRLTPAQLDQLIALCRQESGIFQQPQSRREQAVLVDQLELVLYECRCLERQVSKHVVPLQPSLDRTEPTPEEKFRMQAILSEVDDDNYWFCASRDGNREAHYRGCALGATLVHELAPFTGRQQPAGLLKRSTHAASDLRQDSRSGNGDGAEQHVEEGRYGYSLPGIIDSFRKRVDKELPGLYTWFADPSLHVTIRSII